VYRLKFEARMWQMVCLNEELQAKQNIVLLLQPRILQAMRQLARLVKKVVGR
jgi:hypothetical protein